MYESLSQHICPKTYKEKFIKKLGKNPSCSNSKKLESSKIPSLTDPGEAIAGDGKITLSKVCFLRSPKAWSPHSAHTCSATMTSMDTVLLPMGKSIKDRASQDRGRLPVTAWPSCMVLVPLSHLQEYWVASARFGKWADVLSSSFHLKHT